MFRRPRLRRTKQLTVWDESFCDAKSSAICGNNLSLSLSLSLSLNYNVSVLTEINFLISFSSICTFNFFFVLEKYHDNFICDVDHGQFYGQNRDTDMCPYLDHIRRTACFGDHKALCCRSMTISCYDK